MQGPSGEPALAMKHLSASSLRKGIGKKNNTKQNSIFMLPKADQSQKKFLYTVVTLVFMSITFGVYACIVKITVSRAPGFVANDTICTICY